MRRPAQGNYQNAAACCMIAQGTREQARQAPRRKVKSEQKEQRIV
jgi:hypothetical protein